MSPIRAVVPFLSSVSLSSLSCSSFVISGRERTSLHRHAWPGAWHTSRTASSWIFTSNNDRQLAHLVLLSFATRD